VLSELLLLVAVVVDAAAAVVDVDVLLSAEDSRISSSGKSPSMSNASRLTNTSSSTCVGDTTTSQLSMKSIGLISGTMTSSGDISSPLEGAIDLDAIIL